MIKFILCIVFLFVFVSCKQRKETPNVEVIQPEAQASIYDQIMNGINPASNTGHKPDSASFLILPVDITCPTCRKKILQSIVKYQQRIKPEQYIIISAKGGRKYIEGYFREYKLPFPSELKQLVLDSSGYMLKNNLYEKEPVIYYAVQGKVYSKVKVYPVSVKASLVQFYKL